jgi:hypothetical protein
VRDEVPDATELFGYEPLHLLERSRAPFMIHQWRRRRRLRPRYRSVTEQVLQAVARNAHATHVIDSSHFPLRARELQRLTGIDLRLIFLVRDPQRVVTSINRLIDREERARRTLSTIRRNLDLWLTHALCVWVFARQPRARRIFVRYEDFIADPARVLAQIIDSAGSTAAVPDLRRLSTGLPIHANRLIRQETVALKAGEERHRGGSPITAVMQRPWQPLLARMQPAAGRGELGARA